MAKPINIVDVALEKGRALPVSGMNPHPAAKVPADAHLYSEKVAETSVTALTPQNLTLTKGTNRTIMRVEVWRSGGPTNTDNLEVSRNPTRLGEHYNVVELTGAEDNNHHSNIALTLVTSFTDTVGIWVTYWYS